MQPGLAKYKIGFAVLGVMTLVLTGIVITQGSATKHDNLLNSRAQKIATKLETYVSSKSKIPTSLKTAGITENTDAIRYIKLSDKSYKFCVTYKTSDGFDASSITSQIATGGASSIGAPSNESDSSYLYITSSHKKGENCQTITPNFYSNDLYYGSQSEGSGSSNSSMPDTYTSPNQAAIDACDKQFPSTSQNTEYFACLQKATGSSGSSAAPSAAPTSGNVRVRTN